jgi:hypothetical protein
MSLVVKTPSVEMATWAGDLGSAVGLKVYEEYENNLPPQDMDKYLFGSDTRASTADLNGDIDAYAIGTFLSGKCKEVSKTTITKLDTPISQLLYDYYVEDNKPLSEKRKQRIGCFIQGIGGEMWGVVIKDKPTLYDTLSFRVSQFASAYFSELRTKTHTKFNAYVSGIGTKVRANSYEAVQQFVYWIEGQI